MLTIRATARLLKRANIQPDPAPPTSTGRLGDWYANLLILRPTQLVLCVSGRTLLPVLVPAKDIAGLPQRLASGAGEVLRALGVAEGDVRQELEHMRDVRFAKTASRQILGSMNDFAFMLEMGMKLEADTGPRLLLEEALQLARAPCSPIAMDSPKKATCALFSRPTLTVIR